ncbi:MAG TPA: hypothetical protein VMB05_01610 [Solirubrobacteraceae bacterium]|nr:hypothetical protein [Solirubrobacteraceae bacterium]
MSSPPLLIAEVTPDGFTVVIGEHRAVDERPRCLHCRDVIGVYEPMVVLTEGEARATSLLNEQGSGPAGDCYHAKCFKQAGMPSPQQSTSRTMAARTAGLALYRPEALPAPMIGAPAEPRP